MSAEPTTGNDLLEQYRGISSKLKRRFLRKPNVTEACEAFINLGKQCETSDLSAHAGMCWISAARCEGSLGNTQSETACLTRAARQFLIAEEKDHTLGCVSPSQENLEAALGCFAYAASRIPRDCPLQIGLSSETISFFKTFGRRGDIEEHLTAAVEFAGVNLEIKIHCLDLLAFHYIDMGDYMNALTALNKIAAIIDRLPTSGVRSEVILNCEINRLFLLLILRQSPQKLPPSLAKLLEKYTWADLDDTTLEECAMSPKMFILLQSLVAVCQSLDTSNLDHLEKELWNMLGSRERHLLRVLVQIYL